MIWISKPCLQLEDASTPKQQIVVNLAIADGSLLQDIHIAIAKH